MNNSFAISLYRAQVIYCYGEETNLQGSSNFEMIKDLMAAQLGIWIFGIIAL